MITREEKFKKHREKIASNVENNKVEDVFVGNETNPSEDNQKKNTLTMSIDKIIEAHDEYTTIIEQKELQEKLRLEKKEKTIATLKSVGKILGIALALLLIFGVLVGVILLILN